MAKTQQNPWVSKIQQGATFLFLLYVLILLSRSAWTNIEQNRKVEALREEIANLELEIDHLRYTIAYQQTDTFKELEARKTLHLKKPGELVIALPPEPAPEEIEVGTVDAPKPLPADKVLVAWWDYFFEK